MSASLFYSHFVKKLKEQSFASPPLRARSWSAGSRCCCFLSLLRDWVKWGKKTLMHALVCVRELRECECEERLLWLFELYAECESQSCLSQNNSRCSTENGIENEMQKNESEALSHVTNQMLNCYLQTKFKLHRLAGSMHAAHAICSFNKY